MLSVMSRGTPQEADEPRMALITARFDASWLCRLRGLSPTLRIEHAASLSVESVADDLWPEAEILYTSYATPLPSPERAPRLRWVQLYSAGVDPIIDSPLFRSSVIFTTASGVHAVNMAEYVFTAVLAWYHQLPKSLDWQQQGHWPSAEERRSTFRHVELRGKIIGIIGYGSFGREVARIADALGMRVVALHRSRDPRHHGFPFPGEGDPKGNLPQHFYAPDQLHELLRQSDIAVIAAPLTPSTRGMLDEAAFQVMKPTAFLVNNARGEICDHMALVRALQEQRIAGAALDVFHQEPLPSDDPLWRLPNVFMSPHISGLSPHYDERAAMIFTENLRRFLRGQRLYNVVDKAEGY